MTPELNSLKIQPREKAFYFFTSIGNYTGESASSLKEFADRLKEVNEKSLEFHIQRGDFQKWTAEVLQDQELSEKIVRIQKMNLTGSDLISQLSMIVTRHLDMLMKRSNDRTFVKLPYPSAALRP